MSGQLPSSSEIVVVGGGVIGMSVAWELSRAGVKVTVVERDQVGHGTSHLAAGMLAPVAEADPSEPSLLALGIAAAATYPDFIAALREGTQLDPGYRACGTLLAARDADEAGELARAMALRERLGLAVKRLRGSQARALEPGLAPTLRLALELPDDHAVDPRNLIAALADAARRAGAVICEGTEVQAVACRGGRLGGVTTSGGDRIACDHLVVAAGVWAARLGGLPDPAQVPVRPVKGQILRLHDPSGPGLLDRVLRMEGGYVVPRGDGRYVLGATMEERGFDTTVTAGAVFGLLRDATELLPGLSELVIDELAAGLRPGTPDNAPIIGPGLIEGLHWATGHYRGGVLMAPITAAMLTAMLTGKEPPVDAAAFAPTRFAALARASDPSAPGGRGPASDPSAPGGRGPASDLGAAPAPAGAVAAGAAR